MKREGYEKIVKTLLDTLQSGELPFWTKPFKVADGRPVNGLTKKRYTGGNRFLLMMAGMAKGYSSPIWVGFKQAKSLGGRISKGQKGTPITVFCPIKDKETGDEGGGFFKMGYVWNIDQTEGIDKKKLPIIEETANNQFDPIKACEDFVSRLAPKMQEGMGAAYMPLTDTITMPKMSQFNNALKYHRTLFHELGHWTGAESRMNRVGIVDKGSRFGSEKYSYEELVAEIFSLFACIELEVEIEKEIPDSAAYINGWLGRLESNPEWVTKAASEAEKAMNFCLPIEAKIEREDIAA